MQKKKLSRVWHLKIKGRQLVAKIKKFTVSKRFRTAVSLGLLLVFVSYIIPLPNFIIAAPAESTFTMPGTGDGFAYFNDSGYDDGTGSTYAVSTEVRLNRTSSWWNETFLYRKTITLTNTSSEDLATGSPTQIVVDTKALFDAGKLKSNCEDLRLAYYDSGAHSFSSVTRSYSVASGASNCSNSSATTLTFQLKADILAGAQDANYQMYYGKSDATDPGWGDDGYNVGSANATLVAPLNGSATGVDGETGTPTGPVRYSGGKSALLFDGSDDTLIGAASASLNITSNITVEAWINPSRVVFGNMGILKLGSSVLFDFENDQKIHPWIRTVGGSWANKGASNATIPLNQWTHVAMTYSSGDLKMFINGNLDTTITNVTGDIDFLGADPAYGVGHWSAGYGYIFPGKIDEVRVSNVKRYTGNFTPSTTPFVTDANTKLLLHLDENGSDPRNADKALDSSGNGNHGTITSAKYVSGRVGVDTSASDTGNIGTQPFFGHSGAYFEESTINKITNPSFENSVFDTNWGLPYVNYSSGSATYTPNMGKRNSDAPMGAGPIIQGKMTPTDATSDKIIWSKGTQISNDFYQGFDAYQGSIVLWLTPEWNGNDNLDHVIFMNDLGEISLRKTASNTLTFTVGRLSGATTTVNWGSTVGWTVGTKYLIIARWDTVTTLSGSNYLSVTVNGSTVHGGTTNPDNPNFVTGNPNIGFSFPGYSALNGIIEGFTVYRRPLWDGSVGINVGNGNELDLIYNSGTGIDPTLVTGSWDVVFALPTDVNTGTALGTTGQAWSHPFTSNALGPTSAGAGQGKYGYFTEGYYGDNYVDLDGTTSLINGGSDAGLDDLHNQVTVEGWFKPDSAGSGTASRFFSKGLLGSGGWEMNFVSTTQVDAKFDYDGTDGATRANIGAAILDGKWHHIAMTYDETGDRKAKVWVDGVEATYAYSTASAGNYVTDAANNLVVGARYDGATKFDGGIGWIRISNNIRYSSSFTPSVVAPAVDANTLAQWNMNEGTGTALDNAEGTATRDATLTGNWVTSWWKNVGTPTSGTYVPTSEKIYSGGIKITSDVANEGTKKVLTGLTAGQNYVIRAVAHSDGTAIPKVQIWDATNNHEITQMTAANANATRTAPNVFLFTFELPTTARYSGAGWEWVVENCASIEVRLINTAANGTTYWHQVELFTNLIDNPSFEIGSGDPVIPSGWSSEALISGQTSMDSDHEHSGSYAFRITDSDTNFESITSTPFSRTSTYYSKGFWGKALLAAAGVYHNYNSSCLQSAVLANCAASYDSQILTASDAYNYGISRLSGASNSLSVLRSGYNSADSYVDDVYVFAVADNTLTVTPATAANSLETTGLRVDGNDVLSQPLTGISADSGVIKFKITPRHNYADAAKFGFVPTAAYPTLFSTSNNGGNFINLFYENANSMLLRGIFNNSGVDVRWTDPPVLNTGTTYAFEIGYARNGLVYLKVNGVVEASGSMGDRYFANVPTTGYFGSSSSSVQFDSTISSFSALTPTVNTTHPYYKFGAKSVKLVADAGIADEYATAIDPSNTNNHTLSAYVYNGTTGAIGGTVDSTIAQLVFANSVQTTTYTDMGGGWWRLSYTGAPLSGSTKYGIQVKAGKTIYLDGVQLEEKNWTTTYTDGSLGTGYAWTTPAQPDNSTSTRASSYMNYPVAGNILGEEGTVSLWFRPDYNNNYYTTGTYNNEIFSLYKDGNNYLKLNVPTNVGYLVVNHYVAGAMKSVTNYTAFTANKWLLATVTWDSTSGTKFYINNGAPATSANTAVFSGGASLTIGNQARGAISDFRVYDKALSQAEILDLYYQGMDLQSVSTESIDRFQASGTYTTPVLDLGAVTSWSATDDITNTTVANGGTVAFQTATSPNGADWDAWQDLNGNEIQSDPHRYLKVKASLASIADQSNSPYWQGVAINYVPDSAPPTNPSALVTSPGESGGWFNDPTPTFTWPRAGQTGGADDTGEGASGVKGYHVYFGDNASATPCLTVSDKVFVDDPGTGDVEFTSAINLSQMSTHYLRVQTEDKAGNCATEVWQPFVYRFESGNPTKPLFVSVNPSGYTKDNIYTFTWPAGGDTDGSGVWGYCYKAGSGSETCETKEALLVGESYQKALTDVAYRAGENIFYVRTKDLAGNYSDPSQTTFYWNPNAPSAPLNVAATPATGCGGSPDNCWIFSWDPPETFTERIVRYHYSVNTPPDENSPVVEVGTDTPAFAAGTKQGQNKFYVVAEDVVAVNYEVTGEASFTVSSTAPGIPDNTLVTDSSNRDQEDWALTVKWSSPTGSGSDIDHYNIYQSTDGDTFTKIATTTATGYLDTSLDNSKTYYYKVSAEDNAGAESGLSGVVSAKPEGKYTRPPAFGGVPVATTTAHVATIQWSTTRPSESYVEYGLTGDYELGRVGSDDLVTSHRVEIRGLAAETKFHYRVQSLDSGGMISYPPEEAYSSDYTFATKKAPDITAVTVSDINLSSATISWKTTTISTSQVHYGTTLSYDQVVEEQSSSLTTNHTIRLTGLRAGTTYHFKIVGLDADDVEIYSQDNVFETIAFPKIMNVKMTKTTIEGQAGLLVEWDTNVKCSSTVRYFPKDDSALMKDEMKADLTKTHSLTISSMKDNTLYRLQVMGRDQFGNLASGDVLEFTTDIDTRPPVISKLIAETASQGTGKDAKAQIIVSWETDEPGSSQVEYGVGVGRNSYTSVTPEDMSMNKTHVVVISDLNTGTPYTIRVISKDAVGNKGISPDYTVVTSIPSESVLELIMSTLKKNFGWVQEL